MNHYEAKQEARRERLEARAEVIKALKSYGFRWAPSVGAWQRHLSNGARYAAEQVLKVVA